MKNVNKLFILFLIILLAAFAVPMVRSGHMQRNTEDDMTPKNQASEDSTANFNQESSNVKAENSAGNRAVIAFTFDDGYESDYKLAYPILMKYGIKGTSYVIADYADRNIKYALSWEEIKKMAADGWDFGCHTYKHTKLSKMTPEEIKKSMEKENASFEKNGLQAPDIHAYPFGDFNQAAIDVIRQYRKQARLAFYTDDCVNMKNIDPYRIPSVSADMRTEKRLKDREKFVDKACKENAVVVFRVHGMYKEKPDDMGKWPVQTSSGLFAQLVEYCVKKGCSFVTMDELMKMYS